MIYNIYFIINKELNAAVAQRSVANWAKYTGIYLGER